MYLIKRTYNGHGDHDWYAGRDQKHVTICTGRAGALAFPTEEAAKAELLAIMDGIIEYNATGYGATHCGGKAFAGFTFSVIP